MTNRLGSVAILLMGATLLAGCERSGLSPQLAAFQNVNVCKGHSFKTFLSSSEKPGTTEWQEGETEAYGPIVGMISTIKGSGGELRIGLQARYSESSIEPGFYTFSPVAMEILNLESQQGMGVNSEAIFVSLIQLCNAAIKNEEPDRLYGFPLPTMTASVPQTEAP